VAYRAGYDRLVQDHGQRPGVIEYLHLLNLAVDYTLEAVEAAMAPCLASVRKWRASDVRAALAPTPMAVPAVATLSPELASYDELLGSQSLEEVAHVG